MKPSKPLHTFALSALSFALLQSATANASTAEDISAAIKDSKVNTMFRYRLETVDEDNAKENATANTLLSRISVTTGKVSNISATVEVDNVTHIGAEDFNDFANSRAEYSVVADPDGTEVNQASLTYHGKMSTLTFGRQRINLDDQRFVGGVAWRQNEQTYDGVRFVMKPTDDITLDASYIHNVNRIFGEDSIQQHADLDGDTVLLNGKYTISKGHSVSAFYYGLDFDNAVALSTDTFGMTYNGKFAVNDESALKVKVSLAKQSEGGDNEADFDANYANIEAMYSVSGWNFGGGYELLGSDNGVGFSTPLATLHKFNGFTDKFLGTPANGLEDIYIKASTNVNGVKFAVAYHDFSSDEGSIDYGKEFNFVSAYKFSPHFSGMVKYANYSADDFSVDTDKMWFMLTAKF